MICLIWFFQTVFLEAVVTWCLGVSPLKGLAWLGHSIWGEKSQEKLLLSPALGSLGVPGTPRDKTEVIDILA